ncbi:MCE family protein [Amycolatopsis sp. K13G38]|uniref:MCE family protein n=1 Tax=Amycolatopsis acididurans TaxID=2724524 RepID=A0ABX1JGR1_9PSEU|nr:MlaD family protein [Amycolatopsis acididurans]NKQ57736.1 MCE family protein [Amycolatopsis acididurans]
MTRFGLGITFIVVALVAGAVLFTKDRIITTLRPGTTITADFARDYKLEPYQTQAKIAGIPVGVVTAVDQAPDGKAVVHLKIDDDAPAKLRSAPTAVIRPATLLGGKYYVDLVPGGETGPFDGRIPAERTKTPVELDQVIDALPPNTLAATQGTLKELDGGLTSAQPSVKRLLADAPSMLGPTAEVLRAAQGMNPGSDLTTLVSGLESTARTLTERQGQLESILDNLGTASDVLGRRAQDLNRTLALLPSTLDRTKAGLDRLDGTLHKLGDTSGPALPVVQRLDTALQHADPVVASARPLVADLDGLLSDARPLVENLVPTAPRLTTTLDDVRGPVLQRVNGPIMQTVLSPYQGTGRYAGSGDGKPFYQELGYLVAELDRVSSLTSANGANLAFAPGIAPGSLGGLPISLEQLFSNLAVLSGQGGR